MARRQKKYSEEETAEILEKYKNSQNVWEQKRLLCLKLRVEKQMTAQEISEIVGYKKSTVEGIISKYQKCGMESILWNKKQGNHRNFSAKEETEILDKFTQQAESGQMLIVTDIKKAYEEKVERTVPDSTIYRMLKRHNWRKIMPRSKHPKAPIAEEIEAYKKNL